MKNILIILAFINISCSDKNGRFITDKDIVIYSRNFSSDSSRVILIYQYDLGALGNSGKYVAILNSSDSLKDLSNFQIDNSDIYGHKVRWIGNELIQIERDTLIINDSFADRKDTLFNNIKIHYKKE